MENVWTDLDSIEAEEVTPIEQPAELNLQLLPFQRYGVGWMVQQEAVETVSSYDYLDFVIVFFY